MFTLKSQNLKTLKPQNLKTSKPHNLKTVNTIQPFVAGIDFYMSSNRFAEEPLYRKRASDVPLFSTQNAALRRMKGGIS